MDRTHACAHICSSPGRVRTFILRSRRNALGTPGGGMPRTRMKLRRICSSSLKPHLSATVSIRSRVSSSRRRAASIRIASTAFAGVRAARLHIKPREVSRAHVHLFRQGFDPKVGLQMLRDPLFEFAERIRKAVGLCQPIRVYRVGQGTSIFRRGDRIVVGHDSRVKTGGNDSTRYGRGRRFLPSASSFAAVTMR